VRVRSSKYILIWACRSWGFRSLLVDLINGDGDGEQLTDRHDFSTRHQYVCRQIGVATVLMTRSFMRLRFG
jgi:hypothetical protein